jgi:UDP-GlcNAc:undecaprenyl-phosphate GlcNAc-1-phosphate transferase
LSLLALIAAFAVAAVVAAMSTPVVSRLAVALEAVDRPNERKVNKRAGIPLLGGIAVALGFLVGLAAAISIAAPEQIRASHVEAYLIGGVLILGLGAWDDRFSLRATPKLIGQVAAAAVAIGLGFQIDHLTEPLSHQRFDFPLWLVWLATGVWIVGVTNALNLMDGLDGLATGLGAIIATTLTVIAFQANQPPAVLVGVALVGALVGFLPFNFSPARIFLGDTGALFIGYSLSLLALEAYQKVTVLTFLVPLLALAVPIIDTGLSVLRRLRQRAPIFSADRQHMHHRMLESEGSQRAAVLSIWFLTACFCIIAVSFTRLEGWAALLFLAAVVLLTLRLLRNLGFFDFSEPSGGGAEGPREEPH